MRIGRNMFRPARPGWCVAAMSLAVVSGCALSPSHEVVPIAPTQQVCQGCGAPTPAECLCRPDPLSQGFHTTRWRVLGDERTECADIDVTVQEEILPPPLENPQFSESRPRLSSAMPPAVGDDNHRGAMAPEPPAFLVEPVPVPPDESLALILVDVFQEIPDEFPPRDQAAVSASEPVEDFAEMPVVEPAEVSEVSFVALSEEVPAVDAVAASAEVPVVVPVTVSEPAPAEASEPVAAAVSEPVPVAVSTKAPVGWDGEIRVIRQWQPNWQLPR